MFLVWGETLIVMLAAWLVARSVGVAGVWLAADSSWAAANRCSRT
jgi:hypothetical protein